MKKYLFTIIFLSTNSLVFYSDASYTNLIQKVSEIGAGFFAANAAAMTFNHSTAAVYSLGAAIACCILHTATKKVIGRRNIAELDTTNPLTWYNNLHKSGLLIGLFLNIIVRSAQSARCIGQFNCLRPLSFLHTLGL